MCIRDSIKATPRTTTGFLPILSKSVPIVGEAIKPTIYSTKRIFPTTSAVWSFDKLRYFLPLRIMIFVISFSTMVGYINTATHRKAQRLRLDMESCSSIFPKNARLTLVSPTLLSFLRF
eukprot:TRINITY_DN9037_c0_g1_i8.p2 TRINITY_DN9037_c0_g1~~TRINITY_DN9037_c0_g1_i8.p2  ORF type:complete len:119 (+),score=5.03 TRINITY_DN9037_c0_g1_i8:111-467(+)